MIDSTRRLRAMSQDAARFVDHDPRQACVECREGQVPGTGPLRPVEAPVGRGWIAARVEDGEGATIPGEKVEIELEGGQMLRGRTSEDGIVRFDDVADDVGIARVVLETLPTEGRAHR